MNQDQKVAAESTERAGCERTMYRERPHPLALLLPGLMLAASIVVACLAAQHVPGLGVRLGIRTESVHAFDAACGWLLVIVPTIIGANLVATAAELLTTTYSLTSRRIVARSDMLRVTSSTTYLTKVESVYCAQGPIERLCDTGTITVVATGGFRDTLTHVRSLSRMAAALDRAMADHHASP